MSTQPEALRLADELEDEHYPWRRFPAAAELRRLHAEVERLSLDSIHTCHAECQRPLCKLTRERDALLEACKTLVNLPETEDWIATLRLAVEQARAAITKAEEA